MKIKLTDPREYPDWLINTLGELKLLEEAIVNGKSFSEMAEGILSLDRLQLLLINFLPIVASFPGYMSLILKNIPAEEVEKNNLARFWLKENIEIEQNHLDWYRDWAIGFGVPKSMIDKPKPPLPEVNEMHHFLLGICGNGSVAEALAGLNYAFEGPTGTWTRKVYRNINKYKKQGAVLNKKSKAWLAFHARYDEFHPLEALELIRVFAETKNEQEKVKSAAKIGMTYYAKVADTCYALV